MRALLPRVTPRRLQRRFACLRAQLRVGLQMGVLLPVYLHLLLLVPLLHLPTRHACLQCWHRVHLLRLLLHTLALLGMWSVPTRLLVRS